MKKILALIFALVMILSLTLVPVGAAENEALKGTPVLDGKLDDMYKQSFKTTVDTSNVLWVPVASEDKVVADVYFLHDGEYLYVAAKVTGDSAVVDTGLKTWCADSIEVWFSDVDNYFSKVPMPAFNTTLPGGAISDGENQLGVPFSKVSMAATQYEGGYIVEVKLPIPYYDLSTKDSVGINLQLNNVYAADTDSSNITERHGGAYGTQGHSEGLNSRIIIHLSDKTASDAPATDGDVPSKTGDVAISVLGGMLAVSAIGGAVIISKKKKF